MRVAILSLCKRQKDFPLLSVGLAKIGNASLLKYQIMLARRAGAAKILCHIDSVPGELAQHERFAKERGLEWENIRSITEISSQIDEADDILVIADGYYSDVTLFDDFIVSQDADILTADSDGSFAGFERLDINTLWAGLLKLRGSAVADLSQFPNDWSLESVLLRQAITGKAVMKPVSDASVRSSGICDVMSQPVDLAKSLSAVSVTDRKWQPFQFLSTWLARKAAPKLWSKQLPAVIITAVTAFFLLLAIGLAWFDQSVAAMISIIIGYGIFHIWKITHHPIKPAKKYRWLMPIILGVSTLVAGVICANFLQLLTAQLFTIGILTMIATFAAAQWALLQILAARTRFHHKWQSVFFDPLLQAIFLAVSAALLVFPHGFFLLLTAQLMMFAIYQPHSDNVTLTKG